MEKHEKCESSYIKKEVLENSITSFVSEKLTDITYVKRIMEVALSDEQIARHNAEIEKIKKEIEKLNKEKDRYLSLFGEKTIPKEMLIKKISQIDEVIQALNIRIQKADISLQLRNKMNVEETLPLLITNLAQFKFWNPSQKREFLRSQIPEFSITKDGIQGATLSFCKLGRRTGRDSSPLLA
jgi:hypothetical protein